MTGDARGGRTRIWLALSAVGLILALIIVPPFISVRRYKNRITEVISASIGRPVRLSSIELRILPQPSFVITDLVVEEDPAYGAEPVLHANSVTARIRMLPLWWRGRLEISRISVDEASLNLVRTGQGRWNLDSLFRIAAARAQAGAGTSRAVPFPYLEATDSRVNIKDGAEKLPYSLVNADLALWQENPGDWRVRLKGQPARTDVTLDLADTGIVRLEGRLRQAPELRMMPVHFDIDWREAQLGQLSRLMLGDDEGWRGDLTGEVHVDGTPDAAQVRTRLRASGVHRAEFAPASPIDFDASCHFVYHYSQRGLEKLECNSPVGNGHARLTGDVPGSGASLKLALELDRVPAQLGLDVLRTVRNGLDPSLQAEGAISGKIDYARGEAPAPLPETRHAQKGTKSHAPPAGPLSGSLTVTGLRVSGDDLERPINIPKVTVDPAPGEPAALSASVAVPLGAPTPLNFNARFALHGYDLGIRGSGALPRLRELARMAGLPHASALDKIDGAAAALDITATGPWLRAPGLPAPAVGAGAPTNPAPEPVLLAGDSDRMSGTLTLHNATWKPEFLANPVEIASATLRFDDTGESWDPVAFLYGPVRGTATLTLRGECPAGEKCTPHFTAEFGSLDAAELQAALLGARESGTLLSSLLERFRPGSAGWPALEGTVRAGSVVLGPVTLKPAEADLAVERNGVDVSSLDAGLLGGRIHLQGSIVADDKPDYKVEGQFEEVDAAQLGRLLGMTWTGKAISGSGKIELAGFADKDLAASAKGSLHFDWRRGAIAEQGDAEVPGVLAGFDHWIADASIADGAITLKQNQVQRGARKMAVTGSATFGDPPRVTFSAPEETRAATGKQAKPN